LLLLLQLWDPSCLLLNWCLLLLPSRALLLWQQLPNALLLRWLQPYWRHTRLLLLLLLLPASPLWGARR
jgi:hypothetical protein